MKTVVSDQGQPYSAKKTGQQKKKKKPKRKSQKKKKGKTIAALSSERDRPNELWQKCPINVNGLIFARSSPVVAAEVYIERSKYLLTLSMQGENFSKPHY